MASSRTSLFKLNKAKRLFARPEKRWEALFKFNPHGGLPWSRDLRPCLNIIIYRKKRWRNTGKTNLFSGRQFELRCWGEESSLFSHCFLTRAFLYFITKSKSARKLILFGFYFLLAFTGAINQQDRLGTPFLQLENWWSMHELILYLQHQFLNAEK